MFQFRIADLTRIENPKGGGNGPLMQSVITLSARKLGCKAPRRRDMLCHQ
jgi:hypothetical protein